MLSGKMVMAKEGGGHTAANISLILKYNERPIFSIYSIVHHHA